MENEKKENAIRKRNWKETMKRNPNASACPRGCSEKNHGLPSVNVRSKSAGNSATLGGCWKRFRFQWSGGVQGRHCTQTLLIQLFLSKIAWRIKDATEKPSRESFWIIMKRLPRSQISANSLFLWIDFKVSWRNGLLWRSSWKWTQLNNQCHSESRTTVLLIVD